MTVTYTAEVATCKKLGCFIKLLARWRGSIYKIIWMDLLLFLALYYCINFIYFNFLETESKRTFENIVYYCANYTSLIPLSFVLGFYVNLVMTRWWEQYITIPWPDSIAVFVSAHVHGQDEGGRLMRRTVMRYVCLCLTIVFTMISPCVKKRFPKMKALVDAGLLLENEKSIIEAMDCSFPNYPKHWMPIVWAASIITRARKEGRIRDDFAVKTIIDELNTFRGRCGTLMYYDFISIPLVYTQVVTIAVYSFFVCSLLAHQWTEIKKDTSEALDFYSPVFITLQFFFYMGWLKVAETLINPFGEDDDDFEVNWMIDRNLQVSYLIVDEMHHEHPELVRDQYWDEVYPNELPYESEVKREQPPEPSTAKYDLDDLPKRGTSRLPSLDNSTIVSGGTHSSVQNALSRRSQRFTEAFQRFLNYSEDDETSSRSAVENKTSFPSVSDIENIQHITSYTVPDQAELESQFENENINMETLILEPIIEEAEELSEAVEEEEMPNVEEENDDIETQSEYESDSDFDPFERLRIERQQQRLQRMNDYLERNFGDNFRIVRQFPAASEKNFQSSSVDFISYNKSPPAEENNEEENTLSDLENDENLLTPTISTDYVKFDIKSESRLIDMENDEKLLTPKVSKILSGQNTNSVAIGANGNYENMLQEKTLGDNEYQLHSNLSESKLPLESSLLAENDNAEVKSSTGIPVNILRNTHNQAVSSENDTLTYTHIEPTIQSTSRILNQESRTSMTQDLNESSHSSAQHQSNNSILMGGTAFTEHQKNTSTLPVPLAPPETLVIGPQVYISQDASNTSRFNTRTSREQGSHVPITHDVLRTSRITTQGSFSTPGESQDIPTTQSSIELTITEDVPRISRTNTQTSLSTSQMQPCDINLPKDDESKAPSPLGSARNVSIESPLVDDEERNPSVLGEYRVEIERAQNENNYE